MVKKETINDDKLVKKPTVYAEKKHPSLQKDIFLSGKK